MFQTLHEISKNLIFVFVWKYVNINVSDIKKKIDQVEVVDGLTSVLKEFKA